jgi:formamidase
MRDAFDGQLDNHSTAEEVGNLDLRVVHPLTGPVYVKGVEPNDMLKVRRAAIEADPWEQGYTVELPGFGFLRDKFPDPHIAHWWLHDNQYAEPVQLSSWHPALSCVSAPQRGRPQSRRAWRVRPSSRP